MADTTQKQVIKTKPLSIVPPSPPVESVDTETQLAGDPENANDTGAGSQDASPLTQLALACAWVAEGNSVERLRVTTRKVYPRTIEEARRFQEILDRFRLAANALHSYGNEEMVGLLPR